MNFIASKLDWDLKFGGTFRQAGKIVEKEFYISTSLNTADFSKGIYIYQLIKENVLVAKGVVVK